MHIESIDMKETVSQIFDVGPGSFSINVEKKEKRLNGKSKKLI